MSKLFVLLVLFVTTLLSSLLSPASGQPRPPRPPSARWGGGSNAGSILIPPVGGIPPGGVIEISTSFLDNDEISRLCFREDPNLCFTGTGDDVPSGFQLKSTNSDVASVGLVSNEECDEAGSPNTNFCIILNKPGSTILQLLQNDEILALYVLVVIPSLPGTRCQLDLDDDVAGIVDCSENCVPEEDVGQRLGDGVCDNGSGFDLSCVFIPEFFRTDLLIRPFTHRTDRDGGDCSLEESCTAQFGEASGFEFCDGTDNLCSFSATTGGVTCAEICQERGSRCVAALDNPRPNPRDTPLERRQRVCTLLPNNIDCETRGHRNDICVCERSVIDNIRMEESETSLERGNVTLSPQ
jgi:hypothetical protein